MPHRPPEERIADATVRDKLVSAMRASIDTLASCDLDWDLTESRLTVCIACERMEWYGCPIPCGCADRWIGWRKRIVGGKCERFELADQTTAATADKEAESATAR